MLMQTKHSFHEHLAEFIYKNRCVHFWPSLLAMLTAYIKWLLWLKQKGRCCNTFNCVTFQQQDTKHTQSCNG